jgi:hypothetical protein
MKNSNARALAMNEPFDERPKLQECDIDTHPVAILSSAERDAVERFKVRAEQTGSPATRPASVQSSLGGVSRTTREIMRAANAAVGRIIEALNPARGRNSSGQYPHFDRRSLDALGDLAERIRKADVERPPRRF